MEIVAIAYLPLKLSRLGVVVKIANEVSKNVQFLTCH